VNDPRNPELLKMVEAISGKCARALLSDEELLLLACEELSRTTTYEELQYRPD
jgi:hypothetical protein